MKISRIKEYWHLLEAAKDGKTLQWKSDLSGEWLDYDPDGHCDFHDGLEKYRIKPTPRFRAWKPEEMPWCCWFRKTWHSQGRWILAGVDDLGKGVYMGGMAEPYENDLHTWDDLLGHFEHSLDNGKTWKPCGIEE